MAVPLQRRTFLALSAAGLATPALLSVGSGPTPKGIGRPPDPSSTFPAQDPGLVREMVGVSHGNLQRVRELVTEYPELAKANYDWGFGDWESALGAASHTGRREIAHLLLEHGARPTVFAAAMLGWLEVVRSHVEAAPDVLHTPGPHGIPLVAHARAGGEPAAAVRAYLEGLGGTDPDTAPPLLAAGIQERLLGTFRYGGAADEVLEISQRDGALFIGRPGYAVRRLTHVGDVAFHPAGAPSVRVTFQRSGESYGSLRVVAGGLEVMARRG